MLQRFAFNWKAQTAHGLHSPFVFDLYTQVIDPVYQQNPSDIQEAMIHGIGKHLKLAAGKIQVIDFKKLTDSDLAATIAGLGVGYVAGGVAGKEIGRAHV